MVDYKIKIKNIFNDINEETYIEGLCRNFSKYKYICIFGAGNLGMGMVDDLRKKGITVDFFCDNDSKKIGNVYNGVKCISLDELKKKKENTIVIIATRYYKEIYTQLIYNGINNIERIFTNKFSIDEYIRNNNKEDIKNKLISVLEILEDDESRKILIRIIEEWVKNNYIYGQLDDIFAENQYFPKDIIKLSQHEVFLDAGAYIGDTLYDFLENCNYKFNKVFLFELNKKVYDDLEKNMKNYDKDVRDKIIAFNMGLSDKEKEILYDDLDEGSRINDIGNRKGKAINVDSILIEEKITFIKMDIEGAEMDALKGAEQTIKKYNPKLAICVYHRPQDLWEIPLFIKAINSEYKIFIRHHTDLLNETVCYAIPK